MVYAELREAFGLLRRIPVLWVPGIVAGTLAAGLWLIHNSSGSYFASRLILLCSLVVIFFLAGTFAVIRNGNGGIRELFAGGMNSFFRVLLPLLVIVFGVLLLVTLIIITFSFGGAQPNEEVIGVLFICFLVPVTLFSVFFDTAAVFEDRRVFDAIRRSIALVTAQSARVLRFFIGCAVLIFCITFALMIVWEAALYDKLEPIMRYNETQMAAFTPDQLSGIIGADGTLITAVCLFFGFLLLVPVLSCYKACFFRSLTKGTITVEQQTNGEYDSKGRWYKY